MSDTVLWIAALAIGGGGLLLLGIAGLAAVALRSSARSRRSAGAAAPPPAAARAAAAAPEPQPAPASAASESQQPAEAGPESTWTPWAWLKACIFAIIHAGAVSFVLGGLTFFEDLVRANNQIRRTGNVSFPPNLLPASWGGGQMALLERGSSENADCQRYRAAAEELHERDLPPIETAEWKVVGILDEAGADGAALAGGYHPGQ